MIFSWNKLFQWSQKYAFSLEQFSKQNTISRRWSITDIISFFVATVNRNSKFFVYHGCKLNFLLFSIQVIFPEPRAINRQKNKTPLFCCHFKEKVSLWNRCLPVSTLELGLQFRINLKTILKVTFFQSIYFFIFDVGISIAFT